MATFRYLALTAAGERKRSVIQADSELRARQLLRDQGLFPRELKAVAEAGESRWRRRRGGVSQAQICDLTRQLATLVAAAIPLADALHTLAQQSEVEAVRGLLLELLGQVREGYTLADSLRRFPASFTPMYCALVEAGERSGRLGAVLERLADYQEQVQKQRHKAMTALIYPAVLLLVSLGVVIGLMSFVVPKLTEQFLQSGQALPLITRVLIAISDGLVRFGPLLLLLLGAGVLWGQWLLRRPHWAFRRDALLLRLPKVGALIQLLNSARLARSLAILVNSGVPLLEALQVACATLGNRVIRQAVEQVIDEVRSGLPLHKALAASGHFPPMLLNMVASGEASGTLDQMLERVANDQERSFGQRVDVTLALFEPLMILLMGAIVLFIVLAILLPIMQLNQALDF